jgi:hypothetical protein
MKNGNTNGNAEGATAEACITFRPTLLCSGAMTTRCSFCFKTQREHNPIARVMWPARRRAEIAAALGNGHAGAFLRTTRLAEHQFGAGEIRIDAFLARVEAAADRFLTKIGCGKGAA